MKTSRQVGVDPFRNAATERVVAEALREDVGRGDMTSAVTLSPDLVGTASLVAREACVVAGLPLVARVYDSLAGEGVVKVATKVREGVGVEAGRTLARVDGPLDAVLAGERVMLNFLQQICGTATVTRRFVEAVAGTNAVIVDTRKTIPGLRLLQKYAVRVGGGRNHRFGLDDGVLIKDNHIAACGSLGDAVRRARREAPHPLRIEVECESLEEVDEAVEAGADVVLLDNMTPAAVGRVHARVSGRVLLEVSGGIRLDNVRKYAERGAALISVGALTHSAPAVDLSLEVRKRAGGRRK